VLDHVLPEDWRGTQLDWLSARVVTTPDGEAGPNG
jgi:hypothetical protein